MGIVFDKGQRARDNADEKHKFGREVAIRTQGERRCDDQHADKKCAKQRTCDTFQHSMFLQPGLT